MKKFAATLRDDEYGTGGTWDLLGYATNKNICCNLGVYIHIQIYIIIKEEDITILEKLIRAQLYG